jgi:hypothetical protein
MSKYCGFCGTALNDDTLICWNCGLAQRVPVYPQMPAPKMVEPEKTIDLGSFDLSHPQLRAAETPQPSLARANANLETCEIVYDNGGASVRRFVAKVTGPRGEYEAGRSRNLTGEALFDILDDMAGEKSAGPSSLVQANVDLLLDLVGKLMRAGWTPIEEKGEYWWSRKFTRLIRTEDADAASAPDAHTWELWFRGASNRAFERKLAHQMGFDGKIRLYEIRTNSVDLDAALNGRLFLDFYIDIKDGVFLRQIRAPEDWPQTALMFLDLTRKRLSEILRSGSSLVNWSVQSQTDSEFTLIIERRATLSTGYKIRHKGGISFEPFIL